VARKTVDVADPAFCTTEEAAGYLNVSVSTFGRIVGATKKVWPNELPGVREWCRPATHGAGLWAWDDIKALAHILSRRIVPAAGMAPKDDSGEDVDES
jgi:hypothetical protein